MKKGLIAAITALTMAALMAGCGGQKAAPEAATEATEVQGDTAVTEAPDDWYKAVLDDEETRAQYSYYKLLDINLDGTDELFLSTKADYFIASEDKACLIAYVDGQPKTLQTIGHAAGEYWVYSQSDATLSYFSRVSGEGHYILYQLKDGELKEVGTADTYSPHHYTEEDNDEQVSLINGKKVSEEEMESFTEQYGNTAGAITYDPIDGSN